jgi:hypothetical protein
VTFRPLTSSKRWLSAELTWSATSDDVDLDVILYDGGAPIGRSVSYGREKDVLSARVSGSGSLEMRVINVSPGHRNLHARRDAHGLRAG